MVSSSASASDSDNLVFTEITSKRVVNGIGRNVNILMILPIPIPLCLRLPLQLRFSLGHKLSYDSDYDSDYNSIASEKPALSTLNSYKSHPFIHIHE